MYPYLILHGLWQYFLSTAYNNFNDQSHNANTRFTNETTRQYGTASVRVTSGPVETHDPPRPTREEDTQRYERHPRQSRRTDNYQRTCEFVAHGTSAWRSRG